MALGRALGICVGLRVSCSHSAQCLVTHCSGPTTVVLAEVGVHAVTLLVWTHLGPSVKGLSRTKGRRSLCLTVEKNVGTWAWVRGLGLCRLPSRGSGQPPAVPTVHNCVGQCPCLHVYSVCVPPRSCSLSTISLSPSVSISVSTISLSISPSHSPYMFI